MPRGGQNAIPEAELIDALRRLADELGRSPSQNGINEHSPHSHKTYYRKFDGGLAEAKERAGLEMYEQQGRERVEVDCANCGETLERTPGEVENATYSYCNQECHYEHKSERYAGDGNPQSTLEVVECANCGVGVKRARWERDRYERFFCDHECFGAWVSETQSGKDSPNWIDFPTLTCEWCGKEYSVRPSEESRSSFCSTRCRDNWKSEAYEQDGNPGWAGGRINYMGANWPEQRLKTIIRDQARCRACGATERKHMQAFGEG